MNNFTDNKYADKKFLLLFIYPKKGSYRAFCLKL